MDKQIYINIPVKDLEKATEFYTKIGFVKQPDWSCHEASCMKWSETIYIMLMTPAFFLTFTNGREIINKEGKASVIYSFTRNSKEEVDEAIKNAESVGAIGYTYKMEGMDFMYSKAVYDLDDNILEFVYMDMSKMMQN